MSPSKFENVSADIKRLIVEHVSGFLLSL